MLCMPIAILLYKNKRQFLPSCKVNRYCFLALYGSITLTCPPANIAVNMRRSANVSFMLVQRRRRSASVKPALDQYVVLVRYTLAQIYLNLSNGKYRKLERHNQAKIIIKTVILFLYFLFSTYMSEIRKRDSIIYLA